MSTSSGNITSVLKETRKFTPPESFAAKAHIGTMSDYEKTWQRSIEEPESFWAEQAESLHWFKKWDKVLD
ncbi:MAG: acetyl-coenzyme A synthetase N-terminal domain-containing protein, partial [Gemmataceae bacterium]